jgi:hypothetical protein
MGAIEPAGMPAVRLVPLLKLRAREGLSDEEMVRLQRANLIDPSAPRLANMPPCLIGMEACVGAHHLSRKLVMRSRQFANQVRSPPSPIYRLRASAGTNNRAQEFVPAGAISMLTTKEKRPAIWTLCGWAISVLQEAGAIRECEKHGWMQDRPNPLARERAFDIARLDPPPGASPDDAVAEIRDLLDSIGNTCPECPPEA